MDFNVDFGFFTNQKLFRFFCENKTKMSMIRNPAMLLRHLKDHKIITEAHETAYDPEQSDESVYRVLDSIEKRGEKHVRRFWDCVNKEHILERYFEIHELIQTLKNESRFLPDGSRAVAKESETSERSERRQSMESSTSFRVTQKESVASETPLNLWDKPEHKRWLPIQCGEIEGLLDRDLLFEKKRNCIEIEGQLINPLQFEEMGGKGNSKNWKMSILCQGIPLKTLIERGILRLPPYKGKLVLHE